MVVDVFNPDVDKTWNLAKSVRGEEMWSRW